MEQNFTLIRGGVKSICVLCAYWNPTSTCRFDCYKSGCPIYSRDVKICSKCGKKWLLRDVFKTRKSILDKCRLTIDLVRSNKNNYCPACFEKVG